MTDVSFPATILFINLLCFFVLIHLLAYTIRKHRFSRWAYLMIQGVRLILVGTLSYCVYLGGVYLELPSLSLVISAALGVLLANDTIGRFFINE